MKTLALLLLLGAACPAAAGYTEAAAAMKGLEGKEANDLDGYLLQPGAVLARSERATALLADNQPALDLFRAAAAAQSDGYLFSPKVEKPTSQTPAPKYAPHIKLFKLLLMDARVKAARGQRAQAEENLLAAAGFLVQLSAQRSFAILSVMMEQLCLQKAAPVLAESLRGKAGAAYLQELSARLGAQAKNRDFMLAAMQEEGEILKNSIREAVTPEAAERERQKFPLLKRLAARRLQDKEFFDLVHSRFAAATDERTAAFAKAFRDNDPAAADAFVTAQLGRLKAAKEEYQARGALSALRDIALAGSDAKARLADVMVESLTAIGVPSYGKLVPRYHAAYCGLGVLRTALAVKRYQLAKKRLPDALAQLVPDYLEAVPQDTFNKGAPLAYVKDRKKFTVYSFGPDGKDDKAALELDMKTWFDNPAMSAGDIIYAE
ncbi:MAG: hypothetical protein A2X32_04345 [Elusimicrobia bacterium GWC2_64_44]|nr:MAG: hypothetical protein A2X32_04345 [Elusimicrobia bacterium GWC2_64_44]